MILFTKLVVTVIFLILEIEKLTSYHVDSSYGYPSVVHGQNNRIHEIWDSANHNPHRTAPIGANDIIALNVGGRKISTFRRTLTKVAGSRLADLFNVNTRTGPPQDRDGNYFLDYNPILFIHLLDQLRTLEKNESPKFFPPSSASARPFNAMLRRLKLPLPFQSDDDLIPLNVGGETIVTQRKTLTGLKTAQVANMLLPLTNIPRDRLGRPFLDYDPKLFRTFLNRLRTGKRLKISGKLNGLGNEEREAYHAMLQDLGYIVDSSCATGDADSSDNPDSATVRGPVTSKKTKGRKMKEYNKTPKTTKKVKEEAQHVEKETNTTEKTIEDSESTQTTLLDESELPTTLPSPTDNVDSDVTESTDLANDTAVEEKSKDSSTRPTSSAVTESEINDLPENGDYTTVDEKDNDHISETDAEEEITTTIPTEDSSVSADYNADISKTEFDDQSTTESIASSTSEIDFVSETSRTETVENDNEDVTTVDTDQSHSSFNTFGENVSDTETIEQTTVDSSTLTSPDYDIGEDTTTSDTIEEGVTTTTESISNDDYKEDTTDQDGNGW